MDRISSPVVVDSAPFAPRPFDQLIGVCSNARAPVW